MDKPKEERSGIRPGVIVAVLAVVAVVGVLVAGRTKGWFGGAKQAGDVASVEPGNVSREPRPQSPLTTGARATPGSERPIAPRPGNAPGIVVSPSRVGTTPGALPGAAAATDSAANPDMVADWSTKLDDILGSEDDEAKKADLLLAMWKNLPEEGQIETMQHISNLLSDEKFPVLVQTLTNAAAPEAVLDIIMTDALNRPNAMKLPALLDVAKIPNHPKAEEAREILEVFVDENHGSDWAKWEKAVQDWLKENPDEPDVIK